MSDASARRAERPRDGEVAGGAVFRKKTYRLGELARDVWALAPRVPDIVAVWVGGRMKPALREEVMVAVARVNACRYCSYVHREWALHAGAAPEELERIERGDLRGVAHARWLAVDYARARAVVDFAPGPAVLEAWVADVYGAVGGRDIETVARVMTVANRVGNTFDALLSRLHGQPAPGGRIPDELVCALLFLCAAPWVVAGAAVARRKSPLKILHEFKEFSREFEGTGSGDPA